MAPQIMSRLEAAHIAKRYVCSGCWSNLVIKPYDDTQDIVECSNCGPDTPGYVTQNFAERRTSESRAELTEARDALRDAVPWIKTGKTQDENLKELGF